MGKLLSDDDILESIEEYGYIPHVKNLPRKKKGRPHSRPINPNPEPGATTEELSDQDETKFQMTYKESRHEAVWLENSLEYFFNLKWFNDVLRMVKGGKEASVYLCKGNANTGMEYLAAKVYRPRKFRNLRNDWLYREGRSNLDESGRNITNKGMLHAMNKRTEWGRELLHTSWLEHEYKTLTILHEAGADVPRPFACCANAILMSYYGDAVMGAPTLNDVRLPRGQVRSLFDRILHNIDLMLSKNRIHGDLSAFNILYWEGSIALIDFPQAVAPDQNHSAYRFFERDVIRICQYFELQGLHSKPRQLAETMWQRHGQLFVPPIDPKALGEDREDEREIWDSLKNG
jgi:RIO kinase 1